MGANFTQGKTGGFHLTREGGHSHHRIVHAADATGAEIERALLAQIAQHSNIAMFEHHLATDLITDEVRFMPRTEPSVRSLVVVVVILPGFCCAAGWGCTAAQTACSPVRI